jgi:hypothetical protein
MGGTVAEDELVRLLGRLRQDASVLLDSEEATKQGIILPILSRVGWDRDNIREVIPEYRVENGRVDYCLSGQGKNFVFIEAKRTDQELDRHQEQLLDYAFREGVELAALTNGVVWWLYLPLLQGSWEQRKFFTIDIAKQPSVEVADHFRSYLEKASVIDGAAVRRARQLHESRAKERLTLQTLPKAWRHLLTEPDELLAALLAERVEGLCGHQPTPDQVAGFLARLIDDQRDVAPPSSSPSQTAEAHRPRTPRPSAAGSYTFARPTGYRLRGTAYLASTWKEVLVGVCSQLAKERPADFRKVLQLQGRKRAYFSLDYRGMTAPESIPGTDVFVETNLSANDIAKRCRQVLDLCGLKSDDFEITAG